MKPLRHILLFCLLPLTVVAMGQSVRGAKGQVVDAQTGEELPFVQIFFTGQNVGTTSDLDGNFTLTTTKSYQSVTFQMLGYKPYVLKLRLSGVMQDLLIRLEPDAYQVEEVVVRADRQKDKYKRKGNPAVELMRQVIAHKDSNYMRSCPNFKQTTYEKLTIALDPFDYNLDKNKFWQNFKVVEKYVDTTALDTTPYLPLTMRETLTEEYHKKKKTDKSLVWATNRKGLGFLFDQGNLKSNIETIFQPIDICDNDIDILNNRFVSPLSSSIATTYYQYYIQDTLYYEGDTVIDMAFVPVNSESFSFTGHLYILKDSTYALRHYEMNIPPKMNINWVKGLRVVQDYNRMDDGTVVPMEAMTEVNFTITKKMRHTVFARQTRVFTDYERGVVAPDSIFTTMQADVVETADAARYSTLEWDTMRTAPLVGSEVLFDSLTNDLLSVPTFRGLVNAYTILSGDYIPTNRDFSKSKWDFCPITSTYSYNGVEGSRLRIGGMTTANLNKHWFFQTYVAYGFKDKRPKWQAKLIYSFPPKHYHGMESIRHGIYLEGIYDLEVPGHVYGVMPRDHIFMAIDPIRWFDGKWNTKMQYVNRVSLKYEKEWPNRFSVLVGAEYENNEAAGSLHYNQIQADGSVVDVGRFQSVNLNLQLRYSPKGPIYNNRFGAETAYALTRGRPIYRLTHTSGYLIEDRQFYHKTELTAEYRLWMSSFGHMDLRGVGGIVWTKVPYPKLIIPPTNSSIFLNPQSFNLMRPMEFFMDKYLYVSAEYHAKGWLFNRIPYVRKLRMREVISFRGVWGGLSKQNDPSRWLADDGSTYEGGAGLYEFPDGVSGINWKLPYMELTAGIENIFNFVRIDYIRRLTYNNGEFGTEPRNKWGRNGIKFTFSVTF